jgi:arylsulfatase
VGHLADIFPTVLEIVGANYPTEYAGRRLHPLDGQSLLPHIKMNRVTQRTLCWNYEKFSAIRMGHWKGVRRSKDRREMDGDWQLYDLSKDRSETRDISASHRDVLEKLRRVWEDWRQDIGALHKD